MSTRRPWRRRVPWWGDNRKRLDVLVDQLGKASASYDANRKPIALFDWDNTIIKNDVGDMALFWMLKNDKILQPPGLNWRATNFMMSADGLTAHKQACDPLASPGQPLPTSMEWTWLHGLLPMASRSRDGHCAASECSCQRRPQMLLG